MRLLAIGATTITALALAPILLLALILGTAVSMTGTSTSAVDTTKIPPLAAALLPEVERLVRSCPELPALWVIALAQVESSWDPTAYNPTGHAAGLLQMTEPAWTTAGGTPWPTDPPPADADIWQPSRHLELAIPWICANLRTATEHVNTTRKPTTPLDALLVCHVAGCSRVTESRTGIPEPGEAGCDRTCADTIRSYINNVHNAAERFAATAGPVSITDLPAPAPFTSPSTGCNEPDPTGPDGCLTPATDHALNQITAAFGQPGPTSPIRSVGCWDEHAWNPRSDHRTGRACDLFPGKTGEFATGDALTNGWRLATWLRTHAGELQVSYIIWQGRYWSPTTPDGDGWGRPYTGGGIYNPHDPTGGHWDHVHVSFLV